MEFLDPLARKKRERQLFIGYALLSVLVLLSTYILLSAVQGYELFSRSGSVVQNGLVFVDAQPTAAEIYLNGQDQNKKTDKKLALKDGIYDLTLKASGYRDWQKKLTISGGKVKFVTYPQLYPAVLSPKIMNTYSSSVGFASLSLDKHWLVIQPAANVPVIEVIDVTKPAYTATSFVLPATTLLGKDGVYGSFKLLEWAADNRHFLLQQTMADGTHAVLLADRTSADNTLNLSNYFATEAIDSAGFVDRQDNKVYLYRSTGGVLQIGLVKERTLSPLADNVITYKAYGANLIAYTTTLGSTMGKVSVKISDSGKTYQLGEIGYDATGRYLLDIAHFDGSWYYAVGSLSGDRIQVYRNPLNFLTASEPKTPVVAITIRTAAAPDLLNFSASGRFLMAKSGQNMYTYDMQSTDQYRYLLTQPLEASALPHWQDDFHYVYQSGGHAYTAEFDGQNTTDLGVASPLLGEFYVQDGKSLLSFTEASGRTELRQTDLVIH